MTSERKRSRLSTTSITSTLKTEEIEIKISIDEAHLLKEELKKIFQSDHKDRQELNLIDPEIEKLKYDQACEEIDKNDADRLTRVMNIMKSLPSSLCSSEDYYYAGMIYHHVIPPSVKELKLLPEEEVSFLMQAKEKAVDYLGKSCKLGRFTPVGEEMDSNQWLYAAACDRYLLEQRKPQRYGTQFSTLDLDGYKKPDDSSSIDREAINRERALLGISSFEQQLKDYGIDDNIDISDEEILNSEFGKASSTYKKLHP